MTDAPTEYACADRLPGQGRVARRRRALPDDGRAVADLRRGAGRSAGGSPRALARSGVRPGDKVAILSANDPIAFSCVFGIARAGAVWCPINPRNEAAENRELLELFDCTCLLFQAAFAPLVEQDPRPAAAADHAGLPRRRRRARPVAGGVAATACRAVAERRRAARRRRRCSSAPAGRPGRPKGVMLTGRNLETMSALTLMGYPFDGPAGRTWRWRR